MPTLFTLGCEGLTPDALEALLTEAGVSTVADVRAEPPPHGAEWSQARLAERLEGAGFGYVRIEQETAEDYDVLRGLALDEDVCLMSEAAGPATALAERLANETGLAVVRLRSA